MHKQLNQTGSTVIVAAVAILVIAVVGVVGYRVVGGKSTVATTNSSSATSTKEPNTSAIKSSADVKSAGQSLDSTNVNSTINPSQLDSDISSVL